MDMESRILIVSGDQSIALEIQSALGRRGYDARIASSGKQAVTRIKELSPDLVLIDAALARGMGGIESCGHIQTRFGIPVVYITNDIDELGLETLKRARPYGCVFKTFSDTELQVAVEVALTRRAEEDSLREREQMLRMVTDHIPDMLRLADAEGNTLYFSPSHEEILGDTPDQRIDRSNCERVHPDDRERVLQVFAEALAGSKPGRVEYRARHADGRYIWVETIGDFIYDDQGRATGIVINTRDITERRVMEKALRLNEERYRQILEEIDDGYWEVDLTGRFTFFNDVLCRMMGYPPEEILGIDYHDYTDSETAKRLYSVYNEVYRTGNPANIVDYEVIKKDKSTATHELSVSLMRDNEGHPVGFRGVSRDITPRKRAEEEIRAHREHLALINQILSHDLMNDLLAVHGSLTPYDQSPEKDPLREASERVKKSMDLIARMRGLESFVAFHKELKVCEVRDIIDEVITGYPAIAFEVKGKARVMADDALFPLMDNIVRNAVVHGRADRIQISIRHEGNLCEVHIADNGSGVADDIKKAIFDKGFMHGTSGHTGLGLNIVKKAMERYGGYVSLGDNKPHGAVFTLTFRMVG